MEIKDIITKHGINNSEEIEKLNTFFNDYEIMEELEKADKNRIKRYYWLIPSILISFFGIIYIASLGIIPVEAGDSGVYRKSTIFDGVFYGAIRSSSIFGLIVYIFRKKIEGAIKAKVLTKLAKKIYDSLEYDEGRKFSFGDIGLLQSVGLLASYERIDKQEDSISFKIQKDGRFASIYGYELETSEIRGSGKNKKRVITNHCYLLKTEIPSAKLDLKEDVIIKTDRADNRTNKLLISGLSGIIIGFIFFLISLQLPLGSNFHISIWFVSAFISRILVYYFYNRHINKNRVKLENIEFEKLFDVSSNDQISSRIILDQAFMDRLVNLSNKTKRKYSFLFRDNYFYVKWDLIGSYLEINTWKKITTNIETFLDWYIEMKEIINFIQDMQILYLSKTDPKYLQNLNLDLNKIENTNIINPINTINPNLNLSI